MLNYSVAELRISTFEQGTLHLNNINKSRFILYCLRFAVPLLPKLLKTKMYHIKIREYEEDF